MSDTLIAVLKGGEIVVNLAGEIYQGLRGGDEDDDDEPDGIDQPE